MKTKLVLLISTISAFVILAMPVGACPKGICPASGGSSSVPNFKPTAAARLPLVTAVNGNQISVGKKTYLCDDKMDVTVNGKDASVSAIKVGMRVLVTNEVMDHKKELYKATRIVARTP